MGHATYKDAGVDLDVYEESMSRLPKLMHRTFSPRVIRMDGGFAGLYQLDFASRFAKVLNEKTTQQLSDIINDMYYHIERNANPKILFLSNSFKLANAMSRK